MISLPDEFTEIGLNGQVTLDGFAKVVRAFDQLMTAISADYRGGDEITWIISLLRGGIAQKLTAPQIQSAPIGGEPDLRHTVTDTFQKIGISLRNQTPIRNPRLAPPAYSLASVVDGAITSIDFVTQRGSVRVDERTKKLKPLLIRDYGVVEGDVETLHRRGRLHFTLYDSLFDRAVTCRLRRDQEELMREIWGHHAAVHGLVTRDPQNGRPLEVSEITQIALLPPYDPTRYESARGILPWKRDMPKPEEVIRQMRDAW